MEEKAYGKINLGLSVGRSRADGYHEVDMILQSISLADRITITPSETFSASCDTLSLPCDESNLMVKAARFFQKKTGCGLRVHLQLEKKIFLAAGLAGGSTDAAAVLRGLNRFYQAGLSRQELETWAADIGSDVPFCIAGGTQRGRGRGEKMTVLPPAPLFQLVLIKPRNLAVSTAWAYRAMDALANRVPCSIDALEDALRGTSRREIFAAMENDLERATVRAHPEIAERKTALLHAGAEFAMMSGSGPTVFGIFPDEEKAKWAAQELRKNFQEDQIEVAHTVQEG